MDLTTGNDPTPSSSSRGGIIWPTIYRDEIVISGVSGRFPECENLAEFQENLYNGRDVVTEDDRRWTPGIHGLPGRSGKLKNLDKFDAEFFGVHAKQSHYLDPQVRKLLEVSWEAIMDAGVNPSVLRGSKTGVYVGVYSSESEEGLERHPDQVNGYGLVGCERGMFANRLSFSFDLKGPSFSLDAGCASSLLALEQAVTAIRLGHCDAAIVGGVNLTLKAIRSLQYHRFGMLSPDGRCKAFDASANGYVRSEAVVAIFVQKRSSSLRSHATILHAKTNTDGYKEEGITFPSGQSQVNLLQSIYEEAGVNPGQVTYIECHGTGTKVGDPQEVNAITEILSKNRSPHHPLLIGSVKSNMGHSEAAAGLCGIIKVLIAFKNGIIPQNLHFSSPNPKIPALSCQNGALRVVTSNTKWEGGIAGVSSFGFGGTNVHVILQSGSTRKEERVKQMKLSIVPFSGRTREAVTFALNQIVVSSSSSQSTVDLLQEIHRLDIPRHNYRGYVLLTDGDPSTGEISKILETKEPPPPIWFIFSGMGCQWPGGGMLRDLMVFPQFRQSIEKCAAILKSNVDLDLLEILASLDPKIFDNVVHSFVAITSLQIALLDLLTSLDVMGTQIVGHSVGELACGYASNCFTTEEAVMAAYFRGKTIIDTNLSAGAMAAVGLDWDDLKLKCPLSIYPACHNSTDSATVSGPQDEIEKFVEDLRRQGIFAKIVDSSGLAFHSPLIYDVAPKFKNELEKLIPIGKVRGSKWLSTSVPEDQWDDPRWQVSSADYHVNNLVSPVLFWQAIGKIPDEALVIEIAPHCLLTPILKRALPPSCSVVGLMNKNADNNSINFLKALAHIFQNGHQPNFKNIYGYHDNNAEKNENCDFISPLIQWDHRQSWQVTKFDDEFKSDDQPSIEMEGDFTIVQKTREPSSTPLSLTDKVADILGMKMADISNPKSTLTSLGLDSLQEIQIKNLMEREQTLNLSLKQVRALSFEKILKIQNDHQNFSPSVVSVDKNGQHDVKISIPPPANNSNFESSQKVKKNFRQLSRHYLIYYPVGCLIFIIFTCGLLISLFCGQIVKLILRIFYPKKMILMNRPLDTIFALNDQTSNIIMTFKCEGTPDLAGIMKIFDQRILNWHTNLWFNDKKSKKSSYAPYSLLGWRICHNFFFYFWAKDDNFQLKNHFKLKQIGQGPQEMDKEIKKCAEFYLQHDWGDSTKPQWEVQILSQNSQFALLFVYHHSYGDGGSLSQLISYAFADEPPPPSRNFEDFSDSLWKKFKKGAQKFLKKIHLPFFLFQNAIQLYTDYEEGCRPFLKSFGGVGFGRQKNSKRHCAWSTIELKKLRSIRQHSGGNQKPVVMTTLVLSIVSKVYQRMFDGDGGKKCPQKLVVWLPYAPFTTKRLDLVNNFVCAPTSIPSAILERKARLREIDDCVKFGSSPQYLEASWLFTASMSMMMRPFLRLNAIMPKFPLIFSNVPFDNVPPNFKAFNGHRVTHMFGWTPLCMGTHASLCAAITNELVTFCLVADDHVVSGCPHFTRDFFQFFNQELNSLINIHHDHRG